MTLAVSVVTLLLVGRVPATLDRHHDLRPVRTISFYAPVQRFVGFRPHPLQQPFPPGWTPVARYPNYDNPPFPPPKVMRRPQAIPRPHHHPHSIPSYIPTARPAPVSPVGPSDDSGRQPERGDDDEPRDYFPLPNLIGVLEDEEATTMLSLLEMTDLLETLERRNETYTVFVPSNEAFSRLDRDTVDMLTEGDPELLRSVLQYHIVPDRRIRSKQLLDGMELTTLLANASLQISVNGDVITADGAEFEKERVDQRASNGIAHFLQDVIYPLPQGTVQDVDNEDEEDIVPALDSALDMTDLASLPGDTRSEGETRVDEGIEGSSADVMDGLDASFDA